MDQETLPAQDGAEPFAEYQRWLQERQRLSELMARALLTSPKGDYSAFDEFRDEARKLLPADRPPLSAPDSQRLSYDAQGNEITLSAYLVKGSPTPENIEAQRQEVQELANKYFNGAEVVVATTDDGRKAIVMRGVDAETAKAAHLLEEKYSAAQSHVKETEQALEAKLSTAPDLAGAIARARENLSAGSQAASASAAMAPSNKRAESIQRS